MTYNIRSGYGLDGRLDVEAIVQTIKTAGPEIVALQELSRGWLITGSADLLSLLSRRLAMPATVMGPTIDPLFGNGLLSRYALSAGGHAGLPGLDALVVRGYVWARLDWAASAPLFIVGTHLDSDRSDVRLVQLAALLDEWAGRPQTVLLGDMNARPGSPEIEMILAAGFVDAWAEAGQPDHPRIDWIFHTPDLVARDVMMIESSASDHPAYAATLAPRP
jgi:endonuclease/exonuclease/phosphatase family metal-dependent hydrolase